MSAPADDARPLTPRSRVAWVPLLLVGLGLLALMGTVFWLQVQPPVVTVRSDGFEVESLFYGTSFAADDVAAVSLETRLPRVLARTNGFAAAGTLRGHFHVEGLGPGRLFVEAGNSPHVLVRLREGFVMVNLSEPETTRALYDEMVGAWPDRVVTPSP